MIINVASEQEFTEELKCDVPVVVDFWANWCQPCRMQAPILHEFAEEMGDKIKVIKADVDELAALCYKYSVASIPTIMVFKNGEPVEKTVGLTAKDGLSALVIKYL